MTLNEEILLKLLRKSMFKNEKKLPDNIDFKGIFEESLKQCVTPFVFDSTEGIENIDSETYKLLKQYTVSVMLNNDKVLKAQQGLVELLEKNNYDYAILKGVTASCNYTKPQLRTLGDVDFLVRKKDFEKLKELLLKNKYVLVEDEKEKDHFHCVFEKESVVFEMHFEMSSFPNTPLCNELRDFLQKALDYPKTYEYMGYKFCGLDTVFQAFCLLLHMQRHLSNDGLGLRQLTDWGFFVYNNPDFNTKENVLLLKKYGLNKLATNSMDLFDKYFRDKKIKNKSADGLIELCFKRGNFGVKGNEIDGYVDKELYTGEKNGKVNWFRYFKSRAGSTWPLAKKYPFLQNFGFVYLPVRYLFRRCFKNKTKVDIEKIVVESNQFGKVLNDMKIFEKEE